MACELKPIVDTLAFDLADLRGYHYHSGMVFAAYTRNCPNAIALGGRYDEVGKAFGRARQRQASVWTCGNCLVWSDLISIPKEFWPLMSGATDALEEKIEQLRNEGQIVVVELPGHEDETGYVQL